ncbi:MAG: ATPase, T2SS/T4P/T4SS family [candidate division Zixibacteria bacterium]|nr:ATPase, T2SS/T4P/T4SS family [candidate division Zixibacteria bacterium]
MARKRIGDLLVDKRLINAAQLSSALTEQNTTGKRLGQILVDANLITEDQLIDTVAERLDIPKISIEALVIDAQVVQRVPVEIARRYTLIPVFASGNTLTLAMADPLNIIAIDEIKYLTACDIKRVIAKASEIREAIDRYYSVTDTLNEIMGSSRERGRPSITDELAAETPVEAESPIIKLVNLIISKAVKDRASDIHFEPDESMLRVRFRVHGSMREEAAPPKSMQNEFLSRIKVAANLDLSEKRLPQDGRMSVTVDGSIIDLRVSTLPTIHGEKIVIRILDRRNLQLSFKDLGFRDKVFQEWLNVIHKPEGLILITGPTSSGKTTTLYTTLQEINSIEKNIVTVEDPVEYSLPLINQIQINEKAGLTFPSALRSILRQNPDIIMIGEIRDAETARMAVRSALTGQIVFSTIHTNDAPSTIGRLIDMGIEPYLVATALKGVLAQRLVRTNCSNCTEDHTPSDTLIARAGLTGMREVLSFRYGKGCRQCKGTGFKGMTGIYEFIQVTPAMSEAILTNQSTNSMRDLAYRQGYLPLFEAGLEKLATGQISLEELLKETSSTDDISYSTSAGIMRENIDAVKL